MLIKSDPIDSSANYIDYYINLAFRLNAQHLLIQPQVAKNSVHRAPKLYSLPQGNT